MSSIRDSGFVTCNIVVMASKSRWLGTGYYNIKL